MKTLYFDVETTGLDPVKNDIIQIAGLIEVDGEVKENFNFKMQPFSYENISEAAIATHGVTVEDMKNYDRPHDIYQKIVMIFNKYIDKFDRNDKFIVCGYNVRFDIDFLNQFFKKNGNDFLFSYFGSVKDPFPVVSYLKCMGKINPGDLKLGTIANLFKIELENAHDALADVLATREIIKHLDKTISI
jgi:DNA polymerase III subunit epsilon